MDDSFFQTDRLTALVAFAFATTWTPGPNNILLASSGARFGFLRTVPHALGVGIGFPVMVFVILIGLGELFQASALLRETLRWLGAAVLLTLGWKIASAPTQAKSVDPAARTGRPFTFVEAAGFQWINPKAWAMAIGVGGAFLVGGAPVLEALTAAGAFALAGMTSSHSWAAFGVGIRRFLSTPGRMRVFNVVMGALVAGCVVMLFLD